MSEQSNLKSRGAWRLGAYLVVILGLVGGGYFLFLHGSDKGAETKEDSEVEEAVIAVKTVHPRYDKTLTMTEKRPATVRPYFQVDLKTCVPGTVLPFSYDVGSKITQDELLITVSVPDLIARRNQRHADLEHSKEVVKQKVAAVDTAKSDYDAKVANVVARKARENADRAYLDYRKKQKDRYARLLAERSIDAQLVDEQEDQLHAAFERLNAAVENVNAAEADAKAAKFYITEAVAKLNESKAQVKVNEAELKYAEAMLDYSFVRAPFDGVIVRRLVDPGFFVQNAGDGHATPLLTVQRNDIVTVSMRLPDVFAPYVTSKTEAIFETPTLPGIKIRGKVTRFPPSLVTPEQDRTMLVEVDLWNRDAVKFREKLKDTKFRAGLKKGMPGDDGLPMVPQVEGKLEDGREMRLLPGMYGQMTLVLRTFSDVYLLPSQALIYRGGYSYIYLAKDGKARLQPVKVQFNDGKLANVDLLNDQDEVVGDLTGKEEVIVSNQSELTDGQPIKTSLDADWKSLANGGDDNEKH
ncbi:MAG: efflux RND transporter periplasmic adaptor subunit [Gemmataceae bacterium]